FERSVDRHRGPQSGAGPRAVAALRTPGHLPPPPSALVGRESEIAEVTRLFRGRSRLLTLTGPAGVGKTHLALVVAAQLAGESADGAMFIDLTPIRDPSAVLPAIAAALGLAESGAGSMIEWLQMWLLDRSTLLVLDNFEQVLPAAVELGELLGACPGLSLLLTSREPVHLRAEQAFHVPPLALADPLHLPPLVELEQVAAVALFLERARAQVRGFALNRENGRTVLELCIGLDGLPLAIELAAARIAVLSPEMILERLRDQLTLLRWQAQDLPERQQSLRAAIAWSYELLAVEEQGLLRILGVFAGGFSVNAAEAVAAAAGMGGSDVLGELASLVDKNLVLSEETGGAERRFRLLETIREYALEELARQDERRAAEQAHAAYYTALAERAEPELTGRAQRAWLVLLEGEQENLRAALRCLSDGRESEQALRLAAALEHFWTTFGFQDEGRSWLERVLAEAPEAAPEIRAKALAVLGELLILTGDRERAHRVLADALALARSLGDRTIVVRSVVHLGRLAVQSKQWEEANQLLEEGLAGALEAGDAWWAAFAHLQLAALASRQGQREQSEQLLQEALAEFTAIDESHSIVGLG
ncbi:MAG TPA: AAA family ATPase, partial [Dehalococcoidia bacterium]|nr:AAA family ATPase [Dehalococcoidia bacterium]